MFLGKTTPVQTKNIIISISACLVIIGLYNILFFNRYLPITEGWYSVYANYIRDGAMPYRDFHFFLPPFIPLMTAAFMEIFGESLFALRILGIGIILSISTVMFFIYTRLFHALVAALATVASVIFYQSSRAHITYDYLQICILFGLLGALLILKFFDYTNDTTKQGMRWPAILCLFLAGLFGALSFLTKQSNGLFIAAFSFLALLISAIVTLGFRKALKSTAIYAAGFIISILATLIWLYSNNALLNCWDQVFVGASSSKGGLLTILFGWIPRNFAPENIGGLIGIIAVIFLRIYCFPKGFMLNTIGTTNSDFKYSPISTKIYILFLFTFIVTGLCLLLPYWSLEFSYKLKDSYFLYFIYLRVIDISLIVISVFLVLFYFYQFVCSSKKNYIHLFTITVISLGFMLGCGTSARIDLAGTFLAFGMMLGYLFSIPSRFNVSKILTIVFIMSLILFMASWKYIDPYNWWKLAQPDIRTGSTSLDVNKNIITLDDKLLLHFDVTDNSTGFQDETGKIITPSGGTHISTAQKKFGSSSVSFDGQQDYLIVPNSTDFDFVSEDFTIDGWFYFNANNVGYQFLVDRRGEKDQTGWIFYLETDNSLSFLSSSDDAWNNVVLGGTGIVPETGTWMHLAIVRKGDLFTMYRNGIAIKAGIFSGSIAPQTVDPTIGAGHLPDYPQGFNGYIDEFRITKGIARWTTNFVPPVSPFSNVIETATTSLDVKYLEGFVVSEQTARIYKEVTSIIAENTKPGDRIYTFPNIPVFYMLTDRYPDTFATVSWFDVLSDKYAEEDAQHLLEEPPKAIIYLDVPEWVWQGHEEAFRGGKSSGQRKIQDAIEQLVVGGNYQIEAQYEVPDGYKLIVWVATEGYDSNTGLLMHFDGTNNATGFQDETGKIITPSGNAHISTAQKKFGSASGSFDGQGDYLTIPNSADLNFMSEDFTIDGWFHFNANDVGYQFLVDRRGEKDQTGWILYIEQDNSLSFLSSSDGAWDNATLWDTGIVPETGTWLHLAIVRNGDVFTMYKNGIAIKEGNFSGSIAPQTVDPTIGAGHLPDYPQGFNGYIDEFRITKGIARWTTNFVPPALAYTKLADRAY